MIYRVILKGSRGADAVLDYRLFDSPVARRFTEVTQAALQCGAKPHGAYFSTRMSSRQFRERLARMSALIARIDAGGAWPMPSYALTPRTVKQSELNHLHRLFHRFEEQCRLPMPEWQPNQRHWFERDPRAYEQARSDLNELNIMIHRVEHELKSRDEWTWQFFGYHLAPQHPLPLAADDYASMTAQVKFGDLLLCYGTAGKNLYTCFTDDDLDVVRRGEVRQQTTVSSGVLAAFTTDAAYADSAEYERVQYERYHAWCQQHGVSKFGHDSHAARYRFGNIRLGELCDKSMGWHEVATLLRRVDQVVGVEFLTPVARSAGASAHVEGSIPSSKPSSATTDARPAKDEQPRDLEQAGGVVDVFDARTRQCPRKTAIADQRGRLSYAALRRRANQLARYLPSRSVEPGDVVGLLLEPSCELAVALLAVWKAGAVALPMDPAYPEARVQTMLKDAGCRCVLTLSEQAESVRRMGAVAVPLDAVRQWIDRQPVGAPSIPSSPLACLLYTSGSTGRPKGVALGQAALLNKLIAPGAWGRLDAGCRAAWHGSAAFDASLAQLLLPLMHGGSVRALASHERLDPRIVWSALRAHRTTLLDCTPSWLMAMLDAAPSRLHLECIVLGGEILTPAFAARVRARFPAVRIVNVYGPTEACIDATAHEVQDADLGRDAIPIGQALPGYRIVLLDEQRRPVADGEIGELCIGGVGLAEGYWRQPEATAQRFIADPLNAAQRLYCTGDLARRRAGDLAIEFLGRSDQQIKLRGQRIELGEIEALLSRLSGVAAAVVTSWPGPDDGDPVIVAHAVLRKGTSAGLLKEQLRRELPGFMVPAVVMAVDSLPVSPNGKVDRSRLPEPAFTRPEAGPAVATRDALEHQLLALWREVLGSPCGLDDNFFEVGGDSLRAVELTMLIGQRMGIALPLGMLLAQPTVADLALVLARGETRHNVGRVLRLGGGQHGDAAPLFLLPPGSGAGLVYAGLARELSACMPCHALQAVGLGNAPVGSHSMADLAARFADDIVHLQPDGDLRLCGYSAGGAVAHALHGELHRRGRRLSHIVLLDPYAVEQQLGGQGELGDEGESFWRSHCLDMLADAFGLRGPAAAPLLQMAERLVEQGLALADAPALASDAAARRTLAQVRRTLPPSTPLEVFLLLLEGLTNLSTAYEGYAPLPLTGFTGVALMIQPEADPPALRQARASLWQALVGAEVQTCVVPGQHPTLLQRANSVTAIGAAVRTLFATVHRQ